MTDQLCVIGGSRFAGLRRIGLILSVLLCAAHVGSPDVWYDGPAGPYSIRVLIRPPRVVPGLADITVRVQGGAARVTVAPARWDTGPEGAPAPDVAKRVPGDSELFSAQLWLMARGSYRITVNVAGARGQGSTVVPVTARATERLAMPGLQGALLSAAALFLLVGLLTIVGAAVRESVLPPGERPPTQRLRRARIAMAISGAVVTLLLFSGWRWWGAVDAWHRRYLDRPWAVEAVVTTTPDSARGLRLEITDSLWLMRRNEEWTGRNERYARSGLVPDHGKFMHMFLVREPDQAALAHVHPTPIDSSRFDVRLPPLPAGRYIVYADIVEESGATHTLVSRVQLHDAPLPPEAPYSLVGPDLDDGSWSDMRQQLSAETTLLSDGSMLDWRFPAQLRAGEETELSVEVRDQAGQPAILEPYLGMPGHMIIQHTDASVFVHLHPLGTISLAAQQVLAPQSSALTHVAPPGSRITFPYAFPKAGRYRVWVQVKRTGQILTGARDLDVAPNN